MAQRFDQAEQALHGSKPPPKVTEAIVSGVLPDITDLWVAESFVRKRLLAQTRTAAERHRVDRFVEALFEGEVEECECIVDSAMDEVGDPQRVVEVLFEPTAQIIDHAWRNDERDFLKITAAMYRMQRVFRRLTSLHPPAADIEPVRCALLAPAPGEQHMFGLSVVDDAFRRAGWDVDCCGCEEEAAMFSLAAANEYRVIGLSISTDRVAPDISSIVGRLRCTSRNKSVVLMAGGSWVIGSPQSAIDAGFDLVAADAISAVKTARRIVSARARIDFPSMAAE
ncbi:methanogenic corrinoid protein MtbC1 [Rhodoligotrophos appendicifer]|uniref:cobalamin B12-binding domain-containing protein n=1 Tax=Rhodoligotrophos appendicifer TaxID=987056 RepID=UPI0014788674|nr:cobalamin-dependent protein [Rhodoligotrophos appendicifer]